MNLELSRREARVLLKTIQLAYPKSEAEAYHLVELGNKLRILLGD